MSQDPHSFLLDRGVEEHLRGMDSSHVMNVFQITECERLAQRGDVFDLALKNV